MATHQTNLIKLEEAIKQLELKETKPKTKKKNESNNGTTKQPRV